MDPARPALLLRTEESHLNSCLTALDARHSTAQQQPMQHHQQTMITPDSQLPSSLTLHSRRQPSNRGRTLEQRLRHSNPSWTIRLATTTVRSSVEVLHARHSRATRHLNTLLAHTGWYCPAGVCHCAEEAAESISADDDEGNARATSSPADFLRASQAAARETGAVNNAVKSRGEEGTHASFAPGASSRGVSSVEWSASGSSDGGGFGVDETPHGARLRGGLTAQLRVSAQHWSVSQARSRS